jgi:hypothetical protein
LSSSNPEFMLPQVTVGGWELDYFILYL